MARPAKLKVFRTPIGFHDAYVAAPSQKAAIEAWGSDRDVFGRGEAELVTDPDLAAEPLSKPGVVIKRLRGTAEEQIAALPPNKPVKARPHLEAPPKTVRGTPPAAKKAAAKLVPRPSRGALEKAEQALEGAKEKHRKQMEQIRAKEAALAREKTKIARLQAEEVERLAAKLDETSGAYERALKHWRES